MRLSIQVQSDLPDVFVAGVLGAGKMSYDLLQSNAKEEVLNHARLTMEKAVAVRTYTNDQIGPLLETQMKYTFLPQTVPAYSATEVLATLAKSFPDYTYKEATLNPTNPRDRAVDWEADIVNRFRTPGRQEGIRRRARGGYRALALHRAPAAHHERRLPGVPQHRRGGTAHADRQVRSGQRFRLAVERGDRRAGGVGAHGSASWRAPSRLFKVFMASLIGIFVAIGIVLNVMLYLLVIRPGDDAVEAGQPRQPGRARCAGIPDPWA